MTSRISAAQQAVAAKEARWSESQVKQIQAITGKSSFAELFSDFLQERVDKLQETMQENSENQQEQARIDAKLNGVEVIRRIMPDGTIRVTKYAGNEILKTMSFQPAMMAVPDTTKEIPRADDGTRLNSKQAMVLRPHTTVLESDNLFW